MKYVSLTLTLFALFAIAGCQSEQREEKDTAAIAPDCADDCAEVHQEWSRDDFALPPGIEPEKYILTDEPEGGQGVLAARENVENDEEVIVVGRIGGESPWVENRAAFTIVDSSIEACSDIPGDNCPTPWDYCCRTDQLAKGSALVVVVDEKDVAVKADTRAILDVKELSTVVVKGKAKRDDKGNMTIMASGIFVKNI